MRFAEKLIYADNHNLKDLKRVATPIGVNCRLCERQDCAQRAFPPLNREIVVDERLRGVTPFGFKGD